MHKAKYNSIENFILVGATQIYFSFGAPQLAWKADMDIYALGEI